MAESAVDGVKKFHKQIPEVWTKRIQPIAKRYAFHANVMILKLWLKRQVKIGQIFWFYFSNKNVEIVSVQNWKFQEAIQPLKYL